MQQVYHFDGAAVHAGAEYTAVPMRLHLYADLQQSLADLLDNA